LSRKKFLKSAFTPYFRERKRFPRFRVLACPKTHFSPIHLFSPSVDPRAADSGWRVVEAELTIKDRLPLMPQTPRPLRRLSSKGEEFWWRDAVKFSDESGLVTRFLDES